MDSSNQVPDDDMLGRFRNILVCNGLQEQLFAQVVTQLREKGLLLKQGTIVDSTLITSPSSMKNQEKQCDSDAHQVKRATPGILATRLILVRQRQRLSWRRKA